MTYPNGYVRDGAWYVKKLLRTPLTQLVMADEAFFGLKRKVRVQKKNWHITGAPRREVKYEKRRAQDLVTVWGGLGLGRHTPLSVFEHGQFINGEELRRMLDQNVVPALGLLQPPTILGEDNLLAHHQEDTEQLLEDNDIKHMFLTVFSGDLNWMEKVWANLGDIVYEGGKAYASKSELIAALEHAWATLTHSSQYKQGLLAGWRGACKKVLANEGKRVHWD